MRSVVERVSSPRTVTGTDRWGRKTEPLAHHGQYRPDGPKLNSEQLCFVEQQLSMGGPKSVRAAVIKELWFRVLHAHPLVTVPIRAKRLQRDDSQDKAGSATKK